MIMLCTHSLRLLNIYQDKGLFLIAHIRTFLFFCFAGHPEPTWTAIRTTGLKTVAQPTVASRSRSIHESSKANSSELTCLSDPKCTSLAVKVFRGKVER